MDQSNDPELDGKYLGTISKDFVKVADTLKEASYQIRKRGFSDFPIFPISHNEISVGQLLIPKNTLGISWHFYVTYLDEFIQRKLIDEKKKDSFKEIYKNPEEFCCLFVIDEGFTKFTFIPYPID
jgi:hypothetical protein